LILLALATLVTFRLFALLVTLPTLCPLCPWNHVFTWIALLACGLIVRDNGFSLRGLGAIRSDVALALVPFMAAHMFWLVSSDEWRRWP
jgi:hypothetical protein